MLALPVRLGGMGILNPTTCSYQCFNSSKQLTSPLVALIISQEDKLPSAVATLSETRKSIHSENRKLQMPLLIACMTSYQLSSNDWLILVGKKVYPHGYLFFLWTSLVSLCTRVKFEMHFVGGMAGVSQMCHHLVPVVCHSLLTMQWRANWAAFQQYALMGSRSHRFLVIRSMP